MSREILEAMTRGMIGHRGSEMSSILAGVCRCLRVPVSVSPCRVPAGSGCVPPKQKTPRVWEVCATSRWLVAPR